MDNKDCYINNSPRRITIAAPMYNESDGIIEFITEIENITKNIKNYVFDIILVNDGSTDDTVNKIRSCSWNISLKIIDLARNFGHPIATLACLEAAEGDAVIIMDADLQDDPSIIPQFIEKWKEGYEVVYAVRSTREETHIAHFFFKLYYRLIRSISDVDLPLDSGNYSLMSRNIVEIINKIPQRNRYLPGLRAYVGFKQCGIPVPRRKRYDNLSRVGIKGLLKLACNGIFSFSYVPIRIFDLFGIVALFFSMSLIIYALWTKLFTDSAIPAWTSQIIAISLFGGIIILGLGIVGEYVARIYDQLKGFPKYTVRNILKTKQKDEK